jgi:hypothetical protein
LTLSPTFHKLSALSDGQELPWAQGSQICGQIAEHERSFTPTVLFSSVLRQEYFRAKKEKR